MKNVKSEKQPSVGEVLGEGNGTGRLEGFLLVVGIGVIPVIIYYPKFEEEWLPI
jgi:hypothetical protein